MNEKKTESILTNAPECFINRETSWLAFNTRVLEEALNPNNPLAERLNFLAISSSNLDEFYMVRVAGLKDYVLQGITKHSTDGMTPAQELEVIHTQVERMVERQHEGWISIRKQLAEKDVVVLKQEDILKQGFGVA